MWLGQSEKKLHELFEHRARARRRRCCSSTRSTRSAAAARACATRATARWSRSSSPSSTAPAAASGSEGVLVIGATNAPWDVDPAFRRPGRFGEVLFVPPPDLRARVEILKLKLAGKPQGETRRRRDRARAPSCTRAPISTTSSTAALRDGARGVAARRRGAAAHDRPICVAAAAEGHARRRASGSRRRTTSPPTPTSPASTTRCSTTCGATGSAERARALRQRALGEEDVRVVVEARCRSTPRRSRSPTTVKPEIVAEPVRRGRGGS